jgi:hypothetical protein
MIWSCSLYHAGRVTVATPWSATNRKNGIAQSGNNGETPRIYGISRSESVSRAYVGDG